MSINSLNKILRMSRQLTQLQKLAGSMMPQTPQPQKQNFKTFVPMTEALRRRFLSRENPHGPFAGVIGQDNAVAALSDYLNAALQDTYHETPNKAAILLHGGRSNGKSMFARLIGDALDRPFVSIDPNLIKNTDDIFDLASGAAEEAGCPLAQAGHRNGKPFFVFPNLVIFIDEIHGLSKPLVTGLLKALEPKDRILTTREAYVDCSHVLWIGATTERGELLDAFESRFYKIALNCYTKEEVAQIVNVNYPHWDIDECRAVATRSGLIAREALELADAVKLNADFRKVSRLAAIENVSHQRGIDESGMTDQQWQVLESLAAAPGGLNYEQLSRVAFCKVQELKTHILPALTAHTNERPARVMWTGKNSYITPAGEKVLADRKAQQ